MEFLVTYDVSTVTRAGQRRLHRVAKRCEGYGQRVLKSVFECRLSQAQMEELKHELLKEIVEEEDSIRIYRLMEPRARYLQVIGLDVLNDLHEPLVL
ncbi:MAG: CRISPR-associated endonuclease Cas2 [Anaerolineae bacterium]